MAAIIAFLVLFLIDTVIHVLGIFHPKEEMVKKITLITKPLLMPLLLLYYAVGNPAINWLVFIGIFLGWIGDVTLIFPENEKCFLIGLGSFLIGHLLYIIAYFQATSGFATTPAWFYVTIVIYAVLVVLLFNFFKADLKDMKIPVAIYLGLIMTMSFAALNIGVSTEIGPITQRWIPFFGSLLFILSDFLLANQLFKKKFKFDQVIIMVTYIFAQFCIAVAFM
jgi:uncharacterized membrane protein YhhN